MYFFKVFGLMKKGWGKKNIYNKVNKVFGRCDILDEDVVKNMFLGLFCFVDEFNIFLEM